MKIRFARRMDSVRPSTIREILKVTQQPDVISFAGGLPAPELFPVAEIMTAAQRVLTESGPQALQYGQTEGYLPLREVFAAETRSRGISCAAEDVLITTGSQQSLDLTARVLLDPGDCILTENPTYLAALQAFQTCEVRFAAAPTDEGGLIPEALPELIEREHPKLLYTIPNFQNPTGVTLRRERRKALYKIAERYGLLILEDDPYGKLRYKGEDIPPIKALDTQGLVIYMSTVSKTVAPGLRTGWVVAPPEIARKIVVCKQAADLHSSSLDQRILHRYFCDFDNQAHVARIRQAYGERYQVMDQCLRESMPPEFSWTHPEGGMFLWVTCPESIDSSELMPRAMEKKVIFVPGRDFFPDGCGTRYMRLNFSNATPEKIRTGIERLAEVCAVTTAV